jgi:hypothetical protein
MNMALETFPVGTDREPIFKGLPDDRGQSLHWGYVLRDVFDFATLKSPIWQRGHFDTTLTPPRAQHPATRGKA